MYEHMFQDNDLTERQLNVIFGTNIEQTLCKPVKNIFY